MLSVFRRNIKSTPKKDKDNNEPYLYPTYSSSESSSSSVGDDDHIMANDGFHSLGKTQTFIPMKDYQLWVRSRSYGERSADEMDNTHFSHGGWASDSNSLTYSLSDATSTRESGLSSKDSTSVGLNPYVGIYGTSNFVADNTAWVNAWKVRSPGKVKRGHYHHQLRNLSTSLRSLESVKERCYTDRFDNEECIHEDLVETNSISSHGSTKLPIKHNKSCISTISVEEEIPEQKIESTRIKNREHETYITHKSHQPTSLAATLQPSALLFAPERKSFIKKYSESQLQEHDDIHATDEYKENSSHYSYSTTSVETSGCFGDNKSYKIQGKQFLTRLQEQSNRYRSCDDESFFSIRGYTSHSSRNIHNKRHINRRGWIDRLWSPENDLDFNTYTKKNGTFNDVSSKMSSGSYEHINILRPETSSMIENIHSSDKEQVQEEDSIFDMSDDDSISSFLTKESGVVVQPTNNCQQSYIEGKDTSHSFKEPEETFFNNQLTEVECITGSQPKARAVLTLHNTYDGSIQTSLNKELMNIESVTGSSQQIRILKYNQSRSLSQTRMISFNKKLAEIELRSRESFPTPDFQDYASTTDDDLEASLSLLTKVRFGKVGRFIKRFRRRKTDEGKRKRRKRSLFSFRKREESQDPKILAADVEVDEELPDPMSCYLPLEDEIDTSVHGSTECPYLVNTSYENDEDKDDFENYNNDSVLSAPFDEI